MGDDVNYPRALFLIGDESGCSLWRVFFPTSELQRHGVFAHWKHKDDPEAGTNEFIRKVAANFNIIVLPRISWPTSAFPSVERWISALHRAGIAVILEVDDDVYSPGIVHRQYTTHEVERAKGMTQLEQERLDRITAMRMMDGVTVTNRRLALVVRQITDKPVEVVPNAIDARWWKQTLRGYRRIVPSLTIGWAGGNRYTEDLEPVAEAWGRIARRYPDVTFVVQGHVSKVIGEAVPEDRLRVIDWLPLEDYPKGLLNIDIACCSVAPKLFNTAKTPIKLWEFSLSGAVCVVSPTLYGQAATDGEDALVAETADEWEVALSRLVEDQGLRRRLYRNQRRRIAEQHTLEKNWVNWPVAWAKIISDFRQRQFGRRLAA